MLEQLRVLEHLCMRMPLKGAGVHPPPAWAQEVANGSERLCYVLCRVQEECC